MIAGLKTHVRLAALVAAVILVAVAAIALPQWIQGEEPMAIPTATRTAAIPGIGDQTPGVTETATFAMGWFWGPDSQFGGLDGVIRTRVGYTGGTKVNPTYTNLGDHSETIQMDYDPAVISYAVLLDMFWANHSPQYRSYSQQYASFIFYHTEEQRQLAEASKAREEARLGKKVYTEIKPAGTFTWAEDYHQKYYLQSSSGLSRELRAKYPDFEDFVNSTEAARANGYAGGFCPAPNL